MNKKYFPQILAVVLGVCSFSVMAISPGNKLLTAKLNADLVAPLPLQKISKQRI